MAAMRDLGTAFFWALVSVTGAGVLVQPVSQTRVGSTLGIIDP